MLPVLESFSRLLAEVTCLKGRGSCLKILIVFSCAEFLDRGNSENSILFPVFTLFGLLASTYAVSLYKRSCKPFLPLSDSFSFVFYLQLLDLPWSLTYIQTFLLIVSQKLDDDSCVLLWLRMWCYSYSFQLNLMVTLFSTSLKLFSSLSFSYKWKRARLYW